MTDRPSILKTVYLNGVSVGETLLSGEPGKDVELVRAFLSDKGLYREGEKKHSMMRQAMSFGTIAQRIYAEGLSAVPSDQFSIVPFAVNGTFAIELYLKTLGQNCGVALKGHKLVNELYDRLPDSAKALLLDIASEYSVAKAIPEAADFRQILMDLNNVFKDWRYSYEHDQVGHVRTRDVFVALDILHAACCETNKT